MDESAVGTFFSDENLSISKNQEKEFLIKIKNHQLAKGQYYLNLSVGVGNEVTGTTEYDVVTKVLFFEIAYKDLLKTQMMALWHSEWGNVNFKNIEINSL
jgi:hypothetical protein